MRMIKEILLLMLLCTTQQLVNPHTKRSFSIQTAIRALQEVDPFAKCWRAAFLKSNEILITLLDTFKAHLEVSNLKQPNVDDNSNSPLSSFSSSEDISDPEEAE